MQNAKLLIVAPILVTIALGIDRASVAQVTEVEWSGTTGVRTWQDNGNWIGGVFPNDASRLANLSVGLAANLTVQIGATDVSAAGLKLGGTSATVTTSITSSGGRILLGGTSSTIETSGAAGSTNEINAPIRILNQQLAISGPNLLTINGPIEGAGQLQIGNVDSASPLPLGTVHLASANTFTGNIRVGRGNLILGHDDSLGSATYRQEGPSGQFGYNMNADEDRVISNDIVIAEWQTIKGDHSIEFEGDITQTRNRGIINLLPTAESVTISGRLNIWEERDPLQEPETVERRFVVDGTGRTIMSGTIHNDPIDEEPPLANLRQITKTGTGSLLINMTNMGDNNHSGDERVIMGNYHYANNTSLNTHFQARIVAVGGAIGVDDHPPGQNLATNLAFLNQIDPTSVGGLMLSGTEDAATNLNFTSGSLGNAANMSVAAPESGITYTGTITPANNAYKLGGGTGTLILPNAQLSGARSVKVKNGGTVRLLGDNTYTGATSVNTKYTASRQEQAAVDDTGGADSIFYDRLVAPILEVDDLANGGVASSIGSSSNAAANLRIQGSTLRYIGTGDSTDRLFTLGTGGGTIDSSGSGALVFSNSGALAIPDAADHIGTLDDFTANPTEIVNVDDTSDVIVGMTVSDPDTGGPIATACGGGTTRNCLPAGTTVTGISDDGKTIGLSASFGFIWKMDTRLVIGAVDRSLILAGSNMGANVLSPTISNSAKGGKVNIVKTGAGTWLLDGVNTSTGATTVERGTLGGNGGVGGDLTVNSGATFAPGGTGSASVGDFSVGGNFILDSEAVLAIQLSGSGTGNADLLNVTGSANLSGTLNLATLDFSPALGNEFTVLAAAGGVVGSFASTQLPLLAPGLAWSIQYGTTNISLEVVAALPGDYNQNGIVDAADYVVWRDNLGSSTALPNDDTPGVGADDFARWRANFGQPLGGGGVAESRIPPVPEPSAAALATLAVVVVFVVRTRSRHLITYKSLVPRLAGR